MKAYLFGSTLLLAVSLVAAAPAQNRVPWSKPVRVQILLFPGVQIIDFTGPWETFGQAGYRIHTVAENTQPLVTSMGMKVTPDFSFADAPEAEIVVIPGGAMPHDLGSDHPITMWLQRKAAVADHVFTVCNGAFALGAANLTNGLRMTTNAGMIDHLAAYAPGSKAVYDERFVHDGRFITAGGLTAGIDASLYIISRIDSPGRAQEVANQMEYSWTGGTGYVRTQLADFGLSKVMDFNPPLRKRTVNYEGDDREWHSEFVTLRTEPLEQFVRQFEQMAESQGWERTGRVQSGTSVDMTWRFRNHRDETMTAKTRFEPTDAEREYRVSIWLKRE